MNMTTTKPNANIALSLQRGDLVVNAKGNSISVVLAEDNALKITPKRKFPFGESGLKFEYVAPSKLEANPNNTFRTQLKQIAKQLCGEAIKLKEQSGIYSSPREAMTQMMKKAGMRLGSLETGRTFKDWLFAFEIRRPSINSYQKVSQLRNRYENLIWNARIDWAFSVRQNLQNENPEQARKSLEVANATIRNTIINSR